MSKIKNYIWIVLVLGFTGIPVAAQKVSPKPAQRLSAAEATAALNTSISATCGEQAPAAPRALAHDAQTFSADRIASTLNGVWLGRVSGEYDKQLFAKDGFLNVDYYMIVDVKRGEVFVFQEFGPARPGDRFKAKPGAPTWSYVWCARENYKTPSPRQIHEFTKVSDDVNDALDLINKSTGMEAAAKGEVVLSDAWKRLVESKFFDDPKRSLAYAGALFKPLTMGNVQAASGGSLFELRLVGEYRGSGQTAAKFAPGEPIRNVEQGHFLGVSTGSGDFLAASVGLGNAMMGPKLDFFASVFSTQMTFDKVVIGPLSGGSALRKTARK